MLSPLHYLWLWVLPITTLYPAQIRLRSTVEHSFDVGYRPAASGPVDRPDDDGQKYLERWIISPFGTHHHFEHHLFPTVPHYSLPRVHRLLVRCGFSVPTTPGYLAFVFRKLQAERKMAVTTPSRV